MPLTRREFLRAVATTVAVTAFVSSTRSWAVELNPPAESITIPNLDGELFLASEILEDAATDFGRIISRQPIAVLQPGSVQDVQKMVLFARLHGIKVGGMGMVGNSHSTFGQAQVEAGVVIDMSTLNQIHEIMVEISYYVLVSFRPAGSAKVRA
jgi:cytokinin dehydrogenase